MAFWAPALHARIGKPRMNCIVSALLLAASAAAVSVAAPLAGAQPIKLGELNS